MERAIVNTQYTENVTMSRLIEVASKQHGESNVASNRTVHIALRVSFQDCIGSAMATGQNNLQERQVEIKPLITAAFEERQQTNRVHLVHRGYHKHPSSHSTRQRSSFPPDGIASSSRF